MKMADMSCLFNIVMLTIISK